MILHSYQPDPHDRGHFPVKADSIGIDLTRNENPFYKWDSWAQDEMRHILPNIHCYPDDHNLPLLKAIANRHSWSADQVTLGNGSSEVLQLLVRAASIRNPNLRLITSEFTFPLYFVLSQTERIDHITVPSIRYAHDVEHIGRVAVDSESIVILDNPCNPTGTLIGIEEIDWLAQKIGPSSLLIVDEAYIEYAEVDGARSADSLLAVHDNLVLVRTFSKAFGMAGARLGYALSSRPLAEAMNRLRLKFNINFLAVAMAASALGRLSEMKAACAVLARERRRIEAAICDIGACATRSSAGFVFVESNEQGLALLHELERDGVSVSILRNHGHRLRISVGTVEHNDVLISAARRVLNKC